MSLTIKEIAKLANVSRGTVDRVIHGRDNVSEETREKVEAILQKHNYRSNIHAQSLANLKNTYEIGVITNSIGNEFFDQVLEGLKYQNSFYRNINLIIEEIKGYDPIEQAKKIDKMIEKNVQGLIITPVNSPIIKEKLANLNIPIVTVNNDIDVEKLAFVGCDYYNSGELAGDLANIALPNGGQVAIIVGSFQLSHNERINGFLSKFNNKNSFVKTYENQDDENLSYELTKEIINRNNVELIYYAAGGIEGGLRAIKELNASIRVITVDDITVVREGLKSGLVLGSVTQQPHKQGSNAIRMVHDYLIYNQSPIETNNITNNKVILKSSYYVTDK